ncbi:MAG: hypothetical protein N4A44_03145 [Alphaproteobacteria bacterium]|jgi:hypothetical protein|nr:hypothetical protein [Alphaproteobacteria bacterium]
MKKLIAFTSLLCLLAINSSFAKTNINKIKNLKDINGKYETGDFQKYQVRNGIEITVIKEFTILNDRNDEYNDRFAYVFDTESGDLLFKKDHLSHCFTSDQGEVFLCFKKKENYLIISKNNKEEVTPYKIGKYDFGLPVGKAGNQFIWNHINRENYLQRISINGQTLDKIELESDSSLLKFYLEDAEINGSFDFGLSCDQKNKEIAEMFLAINENANEFGVNW